MRQFHLYIIAKNCKKNECNTGEIENFRFTLSLPPFNLLRKYIPLLFLFNENLIISTSLRDYRTGKEKEREKEREREKKPSHLIHCTKIAPTQLANSILYNLPPRRTNIACPCITSKFLLRFFRQE